MLDTIKSKLAHFWEIFSTSMQFNKKLHGWLTIIWFTAAFPISIWLSTSVPFLVFISVYAVVVSHWNLWFQMKIEKKHEENPVEEAIIDRLDKDTDVQVDSVTTEETTISSKD
ncbi:hypothetical protein [Mycetocola sp.]|uniref:hypothetical protein n=1 Tax=Mycetocola sp. TaxID=1871042 RepID=UPI00398A1752